MNITAIKTADSVAAVNRIKNLSDKKFNLGVSLKVPDEFIEKRKYMQSDEFLKDEHNIKMFEIIDDLVRFRDEAAKEIQKMNKTLKDKLIQGVNGFARKESELKENPALNFDDTPSIQTEMQKQYMLSRNILLYTEAKNI